MTEIRDDIVHAIAVLYTALGDDAETVQQASRTCVIKNTIDRLTQALAKLDKQR